jgi:RNA polymerase sigma factor (TIGR02999 family)
MSEVTQILSAIEQGDAGAAERLIPLVYDELRRLAASRLAHEPSDSSLDATGLVHEAYLRLVGPDPGRPWDSRGHFFAAAAEAMRRILIERARRRARARHGGGRLRISLEGLDLAAPLPDEMLMAIDDALNQLNAEHPGQAELVRLRFYAGLTLEDAAEALGISRATAARHWAFARAWLYDALRGDDAPD